MKDKNIVALLTILFFALYFVPMPVVRMVSVGFILLFALGFFTLRIYKKINGEELLLMAPAVSIGISGLFAILLAYFSILKASTMLIVVGTYLVIAYLLSSGEEIKKVELKRPSRLVAILLILSLIIMGIWGYIELNATPRHELDIAIESWPHNATIGENVSFEIYVKNWNYGDAHLKLVFRLNNITQEVREFNLSGGMAKRFIFYSNHTVLGRNLASFDLYVNGEFYTNVHVYFVVKS